MGHPWDNPRHRSWASDTVVTAVLFVILLITTVIVDSTNGPADPPAYLTGLLGAAGMALFGSAASDKRKSNREIRDDAAEAKAEARVAKQRNLTLNEDIIRTERKTDALGRLARRNHPEEDIPDPLIDFPPRLNDDDVPGGEP